MSEYHLHLDSSEQIGDKLAKLKSFAESLQGKALQLQEKERQLKEKELQLKLYRKNILISIKEQLSDALSYDQKVKILEKYRDILQFVAEEVQDDWDEIMA